MTNTEAVRRVVDTLESLAIPYMVVGSFSSNAYSIPRATQDADFVIQLGDIPLARVVSELGDGYLLDPQMTFETITGTYRHVIRLSGSAFKIELFLLGDDAHDQERFRRRVRREGADGPFWLPTAEDVVVWKLRWSKQGRRNKDVDDVRNVLAVQDERLDFDYIHRWCDVHGTRALLDQIRATIPRDL
ncbi:MAG: hypothetical protein HOP29_04690 [Phycisphaerales bacterium]|nr:hypothetical protein [Phycisphaerales bacterium]